MRATTIVNDVISETHDLEVALTETIALARAHGLFRILDLLLDVKREVLIERRAREARQR